jgi:VWFA-related protein
VFFVGARVGIPTRLTMWLSIALFISFPEASSPRVFRQKQDAAKTQRPSPPGTIRVQVRLVPVDVIVTDSRGKPVKDLKKEDFRLYENGSPQEIRHFYLETFTAAKTASAQIPPSQPVERPELTPQSARTFLILMGRGNFQIPFKSVDDLIRFVGNDLLPQDRVAVYAFNRATNFTTDREEITQVLGRYKKLHEWIEAMERMRLSGLGGIYGSWALPKKYQAQIDQIFTNPVAGGSKPLPSTTPANEAKMAIEADRVTEALLRKEAAAGDPLRLSIMQFDTLAADAVTSLPFSEYASGFASTQGDLRSLYTCIDYLRYMEGEKHLLLFTPNGLMLPRVAYDESLAAYANDARVAIDIFQTGGCCPPMEQAASLRYISRLTGGRASIGEYARQGLARINEITRVQYLLGYYPKDENWDQKYRSIDVKVNRPGLVVSFRHGYHAGDTDLILDRDEFIAYSRITAAGGETAQLTDVPFTATATLDDFNGPPKIWVNMLIGTSEIQWKVKEGRYTDRLRITIFYANNKGNYLGGVWKNVDFNLREESYQRFTQSGIPLAIQIPRQVPGQILKIIIYDTGSDRLGSKLLKVR